LHVVSNSPVPARKNVRGGIWTGAWRRLATDGELGRKQGQFMSPTAATRTVSRSARQQESAGRQLLHRTVLAAGERRINPETPIVLERGCNWKRLAA
jgi:hypothetical protein